MRVSFGRMAAVAALLAGGAVPSLAYSIYDYAVGSSISSLTIPESTHGIASQYLAVRVKKDDGTIAGLGDYSYSIDASTYAVSLNFSPNLVSGAHVYVYGGFASNTSASTDFQVSVVSGALTVCSSCATSAIAQRTKDSTVYVQSSPQSFTWDTAPGGAEVVRVYLLDGVVVWAGDGFVPLAHCSSAFCRVDGNVSAYPFGSIPLSAATWSGSSWSGFTDDRPVQFQ